jgi:hypothetical protein
VKSGGSIWVKISTFPMENKSHRLYGPSGVVIDGLSAEDIAAIFKNLGEKPC